MNPQVKLETWISTVGLLRAKLSQTMKGIHDLRQDCRKRQCFPPDELSPLMAEAQELFVEMLKAGEFLGTTQENLKHDPSESFENYLEDWALTQTEDRFKRVNRYLVELSETRISGLDLDSEIWEEGIKLIEEALAKDPS